MPRFDAAWIVTMLAPGVQSHSGIRSGEACLENTRFPTAALGEMILDAGYTEAQVRGPSMFPWLTDKQVRQGLAYERRLRRERQQRKQKGQR